ncbi:putative ubiquitin-protein ligase [Paramyrothecium foliicola]|nr:putative ubiquitin-protein ligase [Paramyrothecium foliicola]
MASSFLALSQTLENITRTKIRELEKQRTIYEGRKHEVLQAADRSVDRRARIALLLKGVEDLHNTAFHSDPVSNIRHWINQAKYDVSVPDELLETHEKFLRSQLEIPSRKLSLGHLYSRLMTEWMAASVGDATTSEVDSFEVVDHQHQRLKELCDKFERVVFEPLETDEVEIDLHLNELFQGDGTEESVQSLSTLRKSIGDFCQNILDSKAPFDSGTLNWCINGLLAEDLLSDEKQGILRDFLENPVVLAEMADILNMRFSNIESWDWEAGENGIPVLPRQQLNGKYRIWMDEDVLQAILIHYIGIKCCVDLRAALTTFISNKSIWKWHAGPRLDRGDKVRRQYYLRSASVSTSNVDAERKTRFKDEFFLSQLPATVDTISGYSDSPDEKKKSQGTNIKQRLLQTLASEAILHKTLNGEVALLQTDLEWFATGLSHTTIFAIMRFFGFSETMIEFFKKMVQAPLDLRPASGEATSVGPRIRRRGVPIAHAPEKLLGELVLFVLDVVVNQQDGMLLYRLHDDLWLCGDPKHCERAWKAMQSYAKLLGLEFNRMKTGSAYITERHRDPDIAEALPHGDVKVGHLVLNADTGVWQIDQDQVQTHVKQLKKQLQGCKSILEWVQTWNSCIGRFFGHTFGEPAFCFGVDHVDAILKTYRWMQEFLFADDAISTGSNLGVVNHIKRMIKQRFGVTDIPDAFIYLPEDLGGLGLRNPFISILVLREDLERCSPSNIIQQFLDDEAAAYKLFKKSFDGFASVDARIARAMSMTLSERMLREVLSPNELDEFFSVEEYRKGRETNSAAFLQAYQTLHKVPKANTPVLDPDIQNVVRYELNLKSKDKTGKAQETRWALQMYGDSLRKDYGGLRLVDKEYLPLGVLNLMRSKAVRWNMVL